MQIPTPYLLGYEKVRASNPELADRYMAHTLIGDPKVDALIDELADMDQEHVHQLIKDCMIWER